MQKGFVLEDMQVLPGTLEAIMHGLIGTLTDRACQALGGAGQIEVNLAGLWLKAYIGDFPGILEPQGGGEKPCRVHRQVSMISSGSGP